MSGVAEQAPAQAAVATYPAKSRAFDDQGAALDLLDQDAEQPKVGIREALAVGLLVALCDLTIYRGAGFAGLAVLLFVAPWLLWMGSPRPALSIGGWIVGGMALLLAVRLFWQGTALSATIGLALLAKVSLAIRGWQPCVLDTALHAAQTLVAGGLGLAHYGRTLAHVHPRLPRFAWLSVVLPAGALALFGTLFVLANPDLAHSVGDAMSRFIHWQVEWLQGFAGNWSEVFFWVAIGWFVVGLLRPLVVRPLLASAAERNTTLPQAASERENSTSYGAIRNMLIAVSVLFAVYLVFEFQTLWFRQFPKGFYYAGYAHQGAAWLTAALALATLTLSLIFRGRTLRDPRLARLRGLAWIWSVENFVLALTVYNRMYIYIDFNGLTRMRMVGLFGISAVVIGFCLVLWKIVFDRDFAWLLRRQLWTLAVAIYLFALIPVDTFVHLYNVRQILAGDLAPAVQISVHPISTEGILVLTPLIDCEDAAIREGIRAMLAERALEAERLAGERAQLGWTTRQLADDLLREKLRAGGETWGAYRDNAKRAEALERFREYAYQWY